jgi:RNA polymerase sigma factor (sigma-70 family)
MAAPERHGRGFPVTSWMLIRQLKDAGSLERERHLRRLVTLYWKPVYAVLRHGWARTDQDAEDLTQGFFISVVLEGNLVESFAAEKGSFRAFLKGAIWRYAMSEHRRAHRQKRGAGLQVVPIGEDLPRLEDLVSNPGQLTPEQVFDVAWTRIVVSRALSLLETRLRDEGRPAALEVFRRYELAAPEVAGSYKEVGAALGMTPDQVKHGLSEARITFRDIVTALVAEYVDGPDELEAELGRLLGG